METVSQKEGEEKLYTCASVGNGRFRLNIGEKHPHYIPFFVIPSEEKIKPEERNEIIVIIGKN